MLGNWETDVYGRCYSTKLPLPAMRVMAGHDKRQGYHCNPRTTYFGDASHKQLPMMIFPWLDDAIIKSNHITNKTATAFLSLMSSLRWVILQDAAVMLSEGRTHEIFVSNPLIFESNSFLDFQMKLLAYIDKHKRDDRWNATIETVLPGVHNRLDTCSSVMMNQHETLKEMGNNYDDFKHMLLKKKSDDMEVIEKKIDLGINTMNDSVSHVFKSEFKQICEHMGSYSPATNSDNLTTLTNYATNNNEKPNNDIIESTITTQNTDVISNNAYTMPAYFDTFPSMLSHWYNVVKGRDETRNKIWRKHLSNSEKNVSSD